MRDWYPLDSLIAWSCFAAFVAFLTGCYWRNAMDVLDERWEPAEQSCWQMPPAVVTVERHP